MLARSRDLLLARVEYLLTLENSWLQLATAARHCKRLALIA
jgi:hypothetical protein